MLVVALLLLTVVCYSHAALPATGPSVVVRGQPSGQCPSQDDLAAARNVLRQNITNIIRDTVLPYLQIQNSSCSCGGPSYRRIAYLDMTDSSQFCPSGWQYLATPIRACTRLDTTRASCNSVFYPSNGVSYSKVCGRITGYQQGSPNAFNSTVRGSVGIDGSYIDGVSLTRGVPGSREHVWSFANAYYETLVGNPEYLCPCMDSTWPYTIPDFIGSNYFCATGNHGSGGAGTTFYSDDLLWDGIGCTGSSTCCQFNQPPWFCRTLPTATSDNLEIRICGDQESSNENTYISNIEIYVM